MNVFQFGRFLQISQLGKQPFDIKNSVRNSSLKLVKFTSSIRHSKISQFQSHTPDITADEGFFCVSTNDSVNDKIQTCNHTATFPIDISMCPCGLIEADVRQHQSKYVVCVHCRTCITVLSHQIAYYINEPNCFFLFDSM